MLAIRSGTLAHWRCELLEAAEQEPLSLAFDPTWTRGPKGAINECVQVGHVTRRARLAGQFL